jgi:hypothetical protein
MWIASLAGAAGLTGTWVFEGPNGELITIIEVKGSRLTGNIEIDGQSIIQLKGTVRGNVGRGSALSNNGNGEFEAKADGDVLDLTISQEEGPDQRAASLPLKFQRMKPGQAALSDSSTPGAGAGDARLVGNWVFQDLVVSGNASFASEEYLALRADGTYLYGTGRAVAGGGNWSWDGGNGGDEERGRWRAADGVLYALGQNGEWARVGAYRMTEDGTAMRITYDGGGKKLWSRQ